MAARRSEIVLATGWTFSELDEQDRDEVSALLKYSQIRTGVMEQRRSMG